MILIMFDCIQIFFAILIFYLCLAFFTGAPFVPTRRDVSRIMVKKANIKKGKTVYDLGSGDGRLLRLSAREGAKAVGFEINPFLVIWSTLTAFLSPYRNLVTTYWKDFWSADLSLADVVYVYLLPWKMEKLEKKIMKECKKGTLVVSNSFIFPHLTMKEKDLKHHVFVFVV